MRRGGRRRRGWFRRRAGYPAGWSELVSARPPERRAAVLRMAFIDPCHGAAGVECELVVPPGGAVYPAAGQARIGVAHPGCAALADLCVELDAFWCGECGWNGRVPGGWCIDVIRGAGARV